MHAGLAQLCLVQAPRHQGLHICRAAVGAQGQGVQEGIDVLQDVVLGGWGDGLLGGPDGDQGRCQRGARQLLLYTASNKES